MTLILSVVGNRVGLWTWIESLVWNCLIEDFTHAGERALVRVPSLLGERRLVDT